MTSTMTELKVNDPTFHVSVSLGVQTHGPDGVVLTSEAYRVVATDDAGGKIVEVSSNGDCFIKDGMTNEDWEGVLRQVGWAFDTVYRHYAGAEEEEAG